jgi:predicted PurR-regulated permease PerM
MVGPLTSAVIIFGLTATTSFKMAIGVGIGLALLRIIQDYVIYPRIVGQGIKMHPLVVVLAILFGEKIGGLTGIFLAIPVVGLMIVFYNHYCAYRYMRAQQEEALTKVSETLTADVPTGP